MSHVVNVPLKDVVSLSSTTHKPSGDTHYYVGLEHIEKNTGRIVSEATEEPITTVKNKFVSGEILYGKLRPNLNKVAMAHRDGVCSTDILVLRPSARLHARYLYHFMLSSKFVNDMTANVSGANLPRVSPRFLLNYSIPLPAVEEQVRIADTLDIADALRHKDQELLRKYDDLAQSIFYEMFGDPLKNERGWAVKRLGDLCSIRRGASPRPIEKFIGGDVPWIKIGDATGEDDMYISETAVKVTKEGSERSVLLHPGALVFANCGVSLGFARILNISGCIHDGWLSLECLDPTVTNQVFLLKLINTITPYLRSLAPGGTQPNLNTAIMKNLEVIVPPSELQHKFERQMDKLLAYKRLLYKQSASSSALFSSYLRQVFE